MSKDKQRFLYEYRVIHNNKYALQIEPIINEDDKVYHVINHNGVLIDKTKSYIESMNESVSGSFICIDERNNELAIKKIMLDLDAIKARLIQKKIKEINEINYNYDEQKKVLLTLLTSDEAQLNSPLEYTRNATILKIDSELDSIDDECEMDK